MKEIIIYKNMDHITLGRKLNNIMNLEFHKMTGTSWPVEPLLTLILPPVATNLQQTTHTHTHTQLAVPLKNPEFCLLVAVNNFCIIIRKKKVFPQPAGLCKNKILACFYMNFMLKRVTFFVTETSTRNPQISLFSQNFDTFGGT